MVGDNLANLRNQMSGNSYWIGSPIMDWRGIRRASMFFDLAASGVEEDTQLKIMLSLDGGVTFDQEVAVYQGEELNTISGSIPIDPNVPESFRREFVDLSEYANGESEKVRLAFVVEPASLENYPVYLDNIEFFLGNNPDPVFPGSGQASLYPNPATDLFHIAFNLDEFEDVQIQIVSLAGQVVHDVTYPNTLNQTYSFHTSLFSKGVFVIKINSETISSTQRLIIQ